MPVKFKSEVSLDALNNATVDTDKFLVSDSGIVKYRTGTQLLSDLGVSGTYVPYTGATQNVNLGSFDLTATRLIKDGGTSSQFLKADGSVDSTVYLSSVGLTMPVAFTVTNSPLTANGTIAVSAAGLASQYIRGDGQLATLPASGGGGGSSVFYYLNGSIAASVATYKQMSNTPVIGGGTDFNLTGNGLIAQFLTDIGNPNRIQIPGGAWNFEMFFNMSSVGGNTKFYVELLKYNGATFTSIASNITVPEEITGGTSVDLYLTSIAVPETVLLTTDRLAIRVYIVDNSGGRTATLHTEDNTLCQITTTFSAGVTSINGITENTQYLAVGTAGSDFNISSLLDTHTFNLPTASSTKRGALSSTDWTTFNSKIGGLGTANYISKFTGTGSTLGNSLLYDNGIDVGIGTTTPSAKLHVLGGDIKVGQTSNTNAVVTLNPYSSALGTSYQWNLVGANSVDSYAFQIREGLIPYLHINNSAGGNAGNIGIGTTSPTSKLSTYITTNSRNGHYINGNNGGVNESIGYRTENANGTGIFVGGNGYNYASVFGAANEAVLYSIGNVALAMGTNSIERMRITNAGNVGIGTTAPTAKLQVEDVNKVFDGYGNINVFTTDTAATNIGGSIAFGGKNSSGGTSPYPFAKIQGIKEGSASNYNGALLFGTTANSSAVIERMRINSTGSIKFNSYGSGTFTGTATQKLAVDSSGNVIEIPIGAGPVDGSGTTNYVTKWTDADTIGNSLLYDDGSGVGIGTTSPSTPLHVLSSGATPLLLERSSTNANVTAQFKDQTASWYIGKSSNGNFAVGGEANLGNTTIFNIASGGNVGIGTTSPGSILSILKSSTVNDENSGGLEIATGTANTNAKLILGTVGDSYSYIQSMQQDTDWVTRPLSLMPNGGNVGIGTTSPETKLTINASANSNVNAITIYNNNTTAGSYSSIGSYYSNGNTFVNSQIRFGNENASGGESYLGLATGTNLATERMRITSAGNVGIGTTNVYAKLQVNKSEPGSNPQAVLRLENTGAYYTSKLVITDGTTNDANISYLGAIQSLGFGVGASLNSMVINSSGQVGIGTTSPGYKLHVNGIIASPLAQFNPNSAGNDPYGAVSVTNSTAAEYSYYGMTRAGNIGTGIGITTSNKIWIGTATAGGESSVAADKWLTLGASNADFIGSVTATSFIGDLTGNAATATYATSATNSTNANTLAITGYGSSQFTFNQTSSAYAGYTGGWASYLISNHGNGSNYFNQILIMPFYDVPKYSRMTNGYQSAVYDFWTSENLVNPTIGTGTTNYVSKFTGANSLGNSLIYDNGTNVGIGTTSPGAKLVVAGSSPEVQINNSDTNTLVLGGFSSGRHFIKSINLGIALTPLTLQASSFTFDTGNVGIGTTSPSASLDVVGKIMSSSPAPAYNAWIKTQYSTTGVMQIGVGDHTMISTGDDDYFWGNILHFSTADTRRMTIVASGNVGIGTTSPQSKLEIEDIDRGTTNLYAAANLVVYTSDAMSADKGGSLSLGGKAVNDAKYGFGSIKGAKENSVNGDISGYLSLYTSLSGVGSVERMRITSSGNVGIGTTTPSEKLVVGGSSGAMSAPTAIRMDDTYRTGGDSFNNLKFYLYKSTNETYGFGLGDLADLQYWAGTTSTGTHRFFTSQTERMRITSVGNVGIGTTTPGDKLTVDGNIYSSGYFNSNNIYLGKGSDLFTGGSPVDGGLMVAGSNNLIFGNALTERMRITSGGNVGIGTTSPSNKLTISANDVFNQDSSGQIVIRGATTSAKSLLIGFDTTSNYGYLQSIEQGTSTRPLVFQPFGGNVGIGTTSPNVGKLELNYNSVNNRAIRLQDQNGIFDIITSGAGSSHSFGLYDETNAAYRLFINSSGNVGIGTTSPTNLLTLKASAVAPVIDISRSGSGQGKNSGIIFREQFNTEIAAIGTEGDSTNDLQLLSTSAIRFHTSSDLVISNERMRITSAGNVGIGTTSPAAKLDVAGDALINGLTVGRGSGSGNYSTAIGGGALQNNTTGDFNTATGFQALILNTTGVQNTATGNQALYGNTIGNGNTAIGMGALSENTTGNYNTAIGGGALEFNTIGNGNLAIGISAGSSITTGNSNNIIGNDLSKTPDGSDLNSSYSLAVGKNSLDHSGYPHIWAPESIYCPSSESNTILKLDPSIYSGVLMDYCIADEVNGNSRVGTYKVTFRSTGGGIAYSDTDSVSSGTTTDFIIKAQASIFYIEILLQNDSPSAGVIVNHSSRLLLRG